MVEVNGNNDSYYDKIYCNDLRAFLSDVEDKAEKSWIFRGHCDSSWALQHSFDRICNRFNVSAEDRVRVENNMIREFKRRLHHYTSNTPLKNATDEWLALMQHHGAPTRLLDFTYSPHVAAYFAFEEAEIRKEKTELCEEQKKANKYIAVWAINPGWFSEKLEGISKVKKKKYKEYNDAREENVENFDYIFRSKRPVKLVLAINPFRLNERLAYQRGVFLCPGNISISFEQNLTAYRDKSGLKRNVIKYLIPKGSKNEETINALKYLDTMNINRITLFPGLDGFAQSFGPRIHPIFLRQFGHLV